MSAKERTVRGKVAIAGSGSAAVGNAARFFTFDVPERCRWPAA